LKRITILILIFFLLSLSVLTISHSIKAIEVKQEKEETKNEVKQKLESEETSDFKKKEAKVLKRYFAVASYYGAEFHGKTTANGEKFDKNKMTAAHKELPFGTIVRVTYRGRSVVVRINDRGPFIAGREIDLSEAAARKIDMIQVGIARVKIEILK